MTTRTIARVIFTTVAVGAALFFLYLVRNVVEMVVIALFVAVAFGRPVDFLDRWLPRPASILAVYVAMALTVFLVGLIVVPPVVDGVDALVRDVPSYVEELRRSSTIREYDDRYGLTDRLQRQVEALPERLGGAVSTLQSVTVGVFAAVFQLLTILVMAFFFLLDGRPLTNALFRQFGRDREERARTVAQDMYRAVGGYVVGAFSIALVAGLSTFVCLTLLGISYAVPLSVLMGFFALIPLVGASIAGAAIAVVAAFENFPTALIVWTIFLLAYQQFENGVLQPLVHRRTVELHPLVVIIAVLTGGTLLGVLGALLAIPVAATVQIAVKELWHFHQHSESDTRPDPSGPTSRLSPEPLDEEARGKGGEPEHPGARVHAEHGADL